VPMNDTYGNIVAIVPSQDAVAEFRVQTNSNSAEYGRYTGGVINVASKSGSNAFHGSAYEFFRNKVLNATNFFANATGAGKPAFEQNQFGANLGGPVIKDKILFFAGYEGFRQRQGTLFRLTVPTADMLRGDFSNYRDAQGQVIPIYDPLTQCGAYGNAPCAPGQVVQRSQFPNNIIPANRINPVARRLADFPIWGRSNNPGDAFTQNFNFARNISTGGDNDQLNFRGDFNISEKQRLLARYTRWNSMNLPVDVYGNGQRNGDPYSPEAFTTIHTVLADTYMLSPTTILDVRVGFMRWHYDRTPGNLGIGLGSTFGFPAYYDQLAALNGVDPVNTIPSIQASGYNFVGTGLLAARDNTYSITPTLTKITGRHTIKFGGELRRADINYYQNNTTAGTYSFTNLFTSRNALDSGATGSSIASFLLGYPSTANIQTSPATAGSIRYQAYFVNDSLQMTQKLTLNLGLRWEIPGVYTERFDRMASFDPNLPNPALDGITLNGQPVRGAYVLVNGPGHPERGLRPQEWKLFAPRVGVAYRLTERTVIRAGAGIYFVPSNLNFPEGPYGNAVNYVINNVVTSIDNQVTPVDTLSNPYPNGILSPPGRDPRFQQTLLGGSSRIVLRDVDWGYTTQWNFGIQHQFKGDIAVEAAYAGLRGVHLPTNLERDQIDPA
ncbi:MAG: TonB-dependent receptor, partial [Blastocatellia bacterium]|nr:TonB-dependent receptor [Blastocatellia bacterium]